MNYPCEALWLSVSPCLQRFDRRLLTYLARNVTIRQWSYAQTLDEPCSLAAAVELLHDYLQQRDSRFPMKGSPIHLLGHGISGVVGLCYAQKYPEQVRSLTLVSVGANPAVSWHAHYYALRQLLLCRREVILGQMARLLFGVQSTATLAALAKLLQQDLDQQLTLHSLATQTALDIGSADVPLLICHGEHDVIIDASSQSQWQTWFKPGDRLWRCPEGKHFFHYDYPNRTAQAIVDYWQSLSMTAQSCRPSITK